MMLVVACCLFISVLISYLQFMFEIWGVLKGHLDVVDTILYTHTKQTHKHTSNNMHNGHTQWTHCVLADLLELKIRLAFIYGEDDRVTPVDQAKFLIGILDLNMTMDCVQSMLALLLRVNISKSCCCSAYSFIT